MTISDAPNCSITYDCDYDDHNGFIIQATDSNTLAYFATLSMSKKKCFLKLGPQESETFHLAFRDYKSAFLGIRLSSGAHFNSG
jgi:hypothetical protein